MVAADLALCKIDTRDKLHDMLIRPFCLRDVPDAIGAELVSVENTVRNIAVPAFN
jgi:hypothetical protein